MPSQARIDQFIAQVEQGDHVEAIERFYHPEASMQENFSAPRVGRETLMAHEAQALRRVRSVQSRCIGPVFANGDRVVIRWHFRFEGLDGSILELEELAYQQWRGDCILHEQFFYDPAQLRAQRTPAVT